MPPCAHGVFPEASSFVLVIMVTFFPFWAAVIAAVRAGTGGCFGAQVGALWDEARPPTDAPIAPSKLNVRTAPALLAAGKLI